MYYEDDRFNPVNDDDASVDKKKKKDVLSEIKQLDSGYHKIKRPNPKNANKKISIEMYTSGDVGCRRGVQLVQIRSCHTVHAD